MRRIVIFFILMIFFSSDTFAPILYTTKTVTIEENGKVYSKKYEHYVVFDEINREIVIKNESTELATRFEYDLLLQFKDTNYVVLQSIIKDNLNNVGNMVICITETNITLKIFYHNETIKYDIIQRNNNNKL